MKKKTIDILRYMTVALAAVFTVSCSDDDLPVDNPAETILLPGDYRFIISKDNGAPVSRVAYADEIYSQFETGDHIGVFASNNPRQIQNDVFAARPITGTGDPDKDLIQVLAPPQNLVNQALDKVIPGTGNQKVEYLFYHPINPAWTVDQIFKNATGINYTVETDQREKAAFQKSDFLWCRHEVSNDDPQNIVMHHLMATIVVKIHKDSIDTSDGKGVVLKNIYTTALGVHFGAQEPGKMNYDVKKDDGASDIQMYCQGTKGDYLLYRAAIPAWHTIPAGSPIITVNLYNRAGDVEEVTYNLANDLSLKDGYYYTFTLRSAVKPAIPEVTIDDSWVLDVFDPETNEIVGLLCREYLRYQPHHNDDESNFKVDAPTGYYEGAYTEDPGFQIKGYAISSHAFVFYNLFNPNNNYIPNLENGTILRMLYDVVATRDGIMQGDPAWPYPHQAGSITIGTGGDENMAMGIFLPKHGHRWVFDEALNCGRSSDDYKELYLHGAKIHWAKRPGIHTYTHCQTETETFDYYYIDNLEPSEDKITNNDAYLYGHIAIPDEGEPFVSYSPFNDGDMRDSDGNKIGITIEHFLKDNRDGYEIDYPLVKIGFNNFWMSKSLRTTKLSASKPLECQNDPDNSSLNYVKFKTLWNEDYFNPTILPPSYVHPRYISASIEDVDFTNINTEHPLLYNYAAVSDPEFVIPSDDDRFISYMPSLNNFYKIMNYFGWCMAAKLMTADSWTNTHNITKPQEHSDLVETEYEAATKYKTLNDAFLPGNVSGFNLQCSGNFQSQFNEFGGSANLWINDRGDGLKESHAPHIIAFGMANAWQKDDFNDIFHFPNELTYNIDPNIGEATSLKRQKALLSRVFYPARFVMNMKGQIDSPASTIKSGLKSAIKGSRSSDITAKPKPSVYIHVPVIENKR